MREKRDQHSTEKGGVQRGRLEKERKKKKKEEEKLSTNNIVTTF